ncbi:MAG: thymidine kinase [Pseudomonadales bacterium]|jgi:thymidine kinase|nr:thymidine kinase [Pseudomonadales bacterium]
MAKLYFRHGTMSSGKTLNLLAVAHNYENKGERIVVIRPRLDTRFGADAVQSRVGLAREADVLVDPDTQLDRSALAGAACILVDEAQFLSAQLVDQLREITWELDVPVIAYGLRTDFRTRAFEGSLRLLELADAIEEVKTVCHFCNSKAIFNLRISERGALVDGPQIELGADDRYRPVCGPCYRRHTDDAGRDLFGADGD